MTSFASGISRRQFIAGSALALVVSQLQGAERLSSAPGSRSKIIGFIKPFQSLPFDEVADTARDIGWDGIEVPLRKNGTIEPAQVEDRLPKLIEALRKRNLELTVLATDVEDAADPLTIKVLRSASKLGIRRYRLAHLRYDLDKPIVPQLENFSAKLRDLAQLNKELNLQGTIQNHSGNNYVGAPVWDIREMIRGLDPKVMGAYFDIGHATLEGGYSWPIQAKLMEPLLAIVSVKDFRWESRQGWKAEWCPLGDGAVRKDFFDSISKMHFTGPISMHFEYPLGKGKEMIAAMKKDLAVLRQWLGQSG
jgi:sugar phosphate isomerase/epimerase